MQFLGKLISLNVRTCRMSACLQTDVRVARQMHYIQLISTHQLWASLGVCSLMNVMSLVWELFTLKPCIINSSTLWWWGMLLVLKTLQMPILISDNLKIVLLTLKLMQIITSSSSRLTVLRWRNVTVVCSSPKFYFLCRVQVSEPLCGSNVCPQNGIGFPVQ